MTEPGGACNPTPMTDASALRLDDFFRWSPALSGIPAPGPGGRDWARHFDDMAWSWSFTSPGAVDAVPVVGHLWARMGTSFYLLHRVARSMTSATCLAVMMDESSRFSSVFPKLVREAGVSPALDTALRSSLLGLEFLKPDAELANVAVRVLLGGAVYVPEGLTTWTAEDSAAAAQAVGHMGRAYRRWVEGGAWH